MGKGLSDLVRKTFRNPTLKEVVVEEGTPMALEMIFDGIVGQIASGVVTAKLSYRQKQQQKNMEIAFRELQRTKEELNAKIAQLSDEVYSFINDRVFPLIFDYVIDEQQEEKISLIINGFHSVIEDQITDEEIILTYFDVLKNLRAAEISFFMKTYFPDYSQLDMDRLRLAMDTSPSGRKRYQTIESYKAYVNNKLEQLGLIQTMYVVESESATDRDVVTDFGKGFVAFFKTRQQ
jgi:hypothetical protein